MEWRIWGTTQDSAAPTSSRAVSFALYAPSIPGPGPDDLVQNDRLRTIPATPSRPRARTHSRLWRCTESGHGKPFHHVPRSATDAVPTDVANPPFPRLWPGWPTPPTASPTHGLPPTRVHARYAPAVHVANTSSSHGNGCCCWPTSRLLCTGWHSRPDAAGSSSFASHVWWPDEG